MNTNDKNLNPENNDKTVVFNSSKNVEKTDVDKTKVQQNSSNTNTVHNDDKTVIDSKPNPSETKNAELNDDSKIDSQPDAQNKGVSKGVLAAGIAGAGAAGLAAGTVFSEEIKGTVEAIAASFTGNSDDIPEVTEEMQGTASLTFSDATGVYEVALTDTIGDGTIDSLHIEAQLVDGTNVQFSASGTFLDQLFNNEQIEVASANDYLSNIFGVFQGFTPESLN
jgi:hypothetical protein